MGRTRAEISERRRSWARGRELVARAHETEEQLDLLASETEPDSIAGGRRSSS